MAKTRPFPVWWTAVLVVAAVIPRLPVIEAGFTIDDPQLLERAAGSGSLAGAVLESWPPGVYRPLVTLHFEVCERVFGGWAPAYHAVSVALHAVVVVLVFVLCRRFSGMNRAALFSALLFALLPSSNEAIAWAASVGDLWATGLVIASVLLAVTASGKKRNNGVGWWMGSLTALILGCTAKETAVVAALLAPAAAWLFGARRPAGGWIAANFAVVGAYLSWHSTRVASPGAAVLLDNPWRCLVRTAQNLVMAVVPVGRNAVGDWLWSGQTMTRLVTIGVVLVLAAWVAVAVIRRDRTTLFGWMWAVAALLPVCPLPWGERYAYLAAVGLAMVAPGLVAGFGRPKAAAAGAAVLLLFGACSFHAARLWTDSVGPSRDGAQNSSTAAAQWKPAPNAVSRTLSPGSIRP